jgi:hypothetical protein
MSLKTTVAIRMGLALAGGMVAIMSMLVVTMGIPMILALPAIHLPRVITAVEVLCFWLWVSVGWGLAFFVGGAAARYIVGLHAWRGWIGAACAVAFVVMFQVLPEWRWMYEPQRGWVFVTPEAAAAERHNTVVICDYTPLLVLCAALAGAALGRLGDMWAVRRLVAKAKTPNVADQVAGGPGSPAGD